jgi:hypothetical protein
LPEVLARNAATLGIGDVIEHLPNKSGSSLPV